jgi:HEPN domain-containing protein
MRTVVAEWVAKAEGDYVVLRREMRARKAPNYDAVCFHSQQCVEKYLKARLMQAKIRFGKIHDLVKLLDAVLPVEPLWEAFRADFRRLSAYAVAYRYPGESANRQEAKDAAGRCGKFREAARAALRLPPS